MFADTKFKPVTFFTGQSINDIDFLLRTLSFTCGKIRNIGWLFFSAAEKQKPKEGKSTRGNYGKGQQGNSRREQNSQRQRQTNSTQNSTRSSSNRNGNRTNDENSKTQARADGLKAQNGPTDRRSHTQDNGSPKDNGTQAEKDKPADGETSLEKAATAHDSSDHVNNHNQGNRRTKRRYIRKTPLNDGNPIFKTTTSVEDTENNSSSVKENGIDSTESRDLPNGQFESQNSLENGTNGFVPLPQRSQRPRKVYYKKDPGSKIQFPPQRENGSVPA